MLDLLANLGMGGGDGSVVVPRSNSGKIMLDGNGRRFIRDDGLQVEGTDHCRCCPPCEYPPNGARANYVAVVTVSGISGCPCGPGSAQACTTNGGAPLYWTPPSVSGVHVCTWNASLSQYIKSLGSAPNCQLTGFSSAFIVIVSASLSGNGFASVNIGSPRSAYFNLSHPVCGTVNPSNVACATTPCCPGQPDTIPPCCPAGRCSSSAPFWQPWALSSAAVTLEFQPL